MESTHAAARLIYERCLAGRLRMVARMTTNLYDAALRPLDLRIGQLTLLAMVSHLGPLTAGELAQHARIEKSTASRDIARLLAAGWLASDPGDDRRERLLRLTPAGREVLERAIPLWDRAQAELERLIGEAGLQAVHQLVGSLP